jgi:sulfide dehydrogenase cytochrome subunit
VLSRRACGGQVGSIPGLAVLLWLSFPAIGTAADAPPGASSCSGCHPASASVQTPVARLIGRPAENIIEVTRMFRTGQRPATVMDRIVKGFSESEIAAIAAWYAAQKE